MIGSELTNNNVRLAGDSRVCEANFYALPFVAQMVIWAIRRVLVGAHFNRPSSDVLPVFHMAGWGDLYESLLVVASLMLRENSPSISALHDIGCPHIAPHEAHLLNSLAHMQNGMRTESALCLCECLSPSSTRLALPALKAIIEKTRAKAFKFVYIDLATLRTNRPVIASPQLLN